MRKIAVEVEQLESCAARMEEKNQDYYLLTISRETILFCITQFSQQEKKV